MILNEEWEENNDICCAFHVGILLLWKKVDCISHNKQIYSDTRARIKMELVYLEERLEVSGQIPQQNYKEERKICWVKWDDRADQIMPEETPQFQKNH